MDRIETLKETLQLLKSGSKIHIKKANRGKFTSYCGGKVTSECIARGKNSPNPAIRKRATFAANARKWKHQQGGTINNLLVYQPFTPEEPKKKTSKKQIQQQEIDQSRFPVQPVYIYKPMSLEWEPKPTQSVQDPLPDTISGISNANNENLNEINKQLKNAGWGKTQRAAILATIVAESGANPRAIGDSGKAKGLFQWHANRFTAGMDLGSQVQLIMNELDDFNNRNAWSSSRKYTKQGAFDAFRGEDLMSAISALTANFIRPANTDGEIRKRYNIAQQLINQLS